MADAPNPFRALGVPPDGASVDEQLAYIGKVVDAFAETEHPRLKPLRKRLNASLRALAKGGKNGVDPIVLARRFAAEVAELQIMTYELLASVVNEVRVKLREHRELTGQEVDGALELLATVLRRLAAAAKRRDLAAAHRLKAQLDEANARLESAGAAFNALLTARA